MRSVWLLKKMKEKLFSWKFLFFKLKKFGFLINLRLVTSNPVVISLSFDFLLVCL
jgi:hypothetical protein